MKFKNGTYKWMQLKIKLTELFYVKLFVKLFYLTSFEIFVELVVFVVE